MAWLPNPWGSLSNPNALGLRSSEPYSFWMVEKPSRVFLSALALLSKTLTTLPWRSNGLLPPRKPCPFVLPECLARVGASCSLELSGLSGSPSVSAHARSISIPTFLSHSCGSPTLRSVTRWISELSRADNLAFSLYGRRPVWPFRSQWLSRPFERSADTGLFFHLEVPRTLRPERCFS